ncbi:multidrug efflux RND transporter permease subunit [bacterium]|nr:multidrug efflux RND transporter permease subunit [bacterium]
MAKLFIHRPVLAMVISLVILLVGFISMGTLPISQYPDITPPTITVTAIYTGASAQVVADTVAAPIEQQVNGAENMLYMQSQSTNDGRMVLTVTFAVGTNPDLAKVDVQNRVNQANALLPPEVLQSGVTVLKKSSQILLFISVFSPDNSKDDLFLSNYVVINLLDRLARIKGVGSATVLVGQRDYSMRAWVSPDKLAKLGVTSGDIINAIKSQNIQAAAGAVGQPPAPKGTEFQYQVQVQGRLDNLDDFKNIIVRTNPDGSILRIRDVSRTELGAQAYNSFGRRNGQPAIPVGIYQQPGANAIELAKELRAAMADMKKSFPSGVDYEVSLDTTDFVKSSIEEVVHTLFEAIGLVLIVVFVFLGNFRATLIPMLAVPVSLVGCFGAFAAMGFSINTLTLFGLVLAIGIVVDDAIVVVEAVEHHISHGLAPIPATEKAMSEVSGPVVAIALVLCSVFVPVAFMGGITGQLYRQFAMTLAFSVCLSALVALTLTPALCGLLLRPGKPMGGPIGLFLKAFNAIFEKTTQGYTFIIRKTLRLSLVMILLLGGIYFLTGKINSKLPTGFLPPEDNGYFMIQVALPDAASLERTDAVMRNMEQTLMKTPGVQTVITLGGFSIASGTYKTNYGTFFVVFKPWGERPKEQSAFKTIPRLQKEFSKLPEASIQCFNPPPIPGLGTTGGVTMELEDRQGRTSQELADATKGYLEGVMAENEVVALAFTGFTANVPQLKLDMDRNKIMVLGINLSDVFQALQVNLGGYFVNQFNKFGRTWRVYVEAEAQYRAKPENIGALYVRSASNNMVPISTLSSWKYTFGPDTITRYNLYQTAEINGINRPGISSGELMKTFEKIANKLPEGYSYEWTGTAYQEKESSGGQVQILVLGLIMVFLFLAAQYESWIVPLSILCGIPIGIMGALGATSFIHMDNNVYVQIGLVMLVGLAAKNAILIVEFAKMEHDKGVYLYDAAVTGAQLRFRPILMTSFAFILGVVPLMKSSGAGAVSRISLGTAVFGGMMAASCLGIFFIPWLYTFVQGWLYRLTFKGHLLRRPVEPAVSAPEPEPAPPEAVATPAPAEIPAAAPVPEETPAPESDKPEEAPEKT